MTEEHQFFLRIMTDNNIFYLKNKTFILIVNGSQTESL